MVSTRRQGLLLLMSPTITRLHIINKSSPNIDPVSSQLVHSMFYKVPGRLVPGFLSHVMVVVDQVSVW